MFANTQLELPASQFWLLDRISAAQADPLYKYKPNPKGVCFGVAHMAMQAILAGEFNIFYRRLQLINAIPVDEMAKRIAKIKKKRVKLVEEVKKNNIEIFNTLSEDEMLMLEKDPVVQTQISSLKEMRIETEEFEKRKKDWMRNTFLQRKIDEAILKLPLDERLIFDIPAFFESVMLYQTPYQYPDLIERRFFQNFDVSVPLCLSKKLEESGGVVNEQNFFTGAYDVTSLTTYFDSLREAIEKTNPRIQNPITFLLQNINHVVTLCYYPGSNEWQIIDVNGMKLAADLIRDPQTIATKTLSALSQNNVCSFSTKIFGIKTDEPKLEDFLKQLENHENWQKLHTVSDDKSKLLDSNNSSWLFLAVLNNESLKLSELLEHHADPNVAITHPFSKDLTPLQAAADLGYTDIVEILLKANANPDAVEEKDGLTPLHYAIRRDNKDIVKKLLAAHANPNARNKLGATPLYYAVVNGYTEILKMLLAEPGIDPNIADTNKLTPLFHAAQEGRIEIVNLLIDNEATNTSLAFVSTVDSLRAFAKNRQVEPAMELFLQQKNSTDDGQKKVSMTPAEIAAVMGHHDIAEKINNVTRQPVPVHKIKKPIKKINYKRYDEYPELADLCSQNEMDERYFNESLEIAEKCKKGKSRDNLPDVFVDGKESGHEGFYLVKLPIADPHAFILFNDKQCVIDGTTLENNGIYVLVKGEPGQPPIVDGKINPLCPVIGRGYAWLNVNKDVLVLDSWRNSDKENNDIFISLLADFGKQVTEKTNILSVHIGTQGGTPKALRNSQVFPEKMLEGEQSDDSLSQSLIYQDPIKLAELRKNLAEKWERSEVKPLGMDFNEFCQFINFDKLSSHSENQLIEKLFLNENMAGLNAVFNENIISHFSKKPDVFRQTIFHIMDILIESELFNDSTYKSISLYLEYVMNWDIKKVEKNFRDLSTDQKIILDVKEKGLLTEEIFKHVISDPSVIEFILDSLEELNNLGMLTSDNAKLLFEAREFSAGMVSGLKLLNQENMLTEVNRQALSRSFYYAKQLAHNLVKLKLAENNIKLFIETNSVKVLVEHPDMAASFVSSLHKLKAENLLSEDNIRVLIHDISYCSNISNAFVKLHNAGLLENNRKLIIENKYDCEKIADCLIKLNQVGLLKDSYRKLIVKDPREWNKLADCFIQLNQVGLLSDYRKILVEHSRDCTKMTEGFIKLSQSGLPSDSKNRQIIIDYPDKCSRILDCLIMLNDKGILSDDTRQLIIQNPYAAVVEELLDFKKAGILTKDITSLLLGYPNQIHTVSRGLLKLNEAGLLTETYINIILKKPYYSNDIADGLAIMKKAGILNEETCQTYINLKDNIDSVNHGLELLSESGQLDVDDNFNKLLSPEIIYGLKKLNKDDLLNTENFQAYFFNKNIPELNEAIKWLSKEGILKETYQTLISCQHLPLIMDDLKKLYEKDELNDKSFNTLVSSKSQTTTKGGPGLFVKSSQNPSDDFLSQPKIIEQQSPIKKTIK